MRQFRFTASMLFSLVLGFTVLCSSFVQTVQAQNETDLFLNAVPSDTFMYMEMENIQGHLDRMNEQFMSEMSDQQKKTFNKRKDKLIQKFASRMKGKTGVDAMDILPHVTGARVAVASSSFDFSGGGKNVPVEDASALIAVELDRADVVSQLLTGKVAKRLKQDKKVNGYTLYRVEVPDKPKDAPTPYLLHRNKHLYMSENKKRLSGIAEGPGSDHLPEESLAENSAFQESHSGSSATENLVSTFVNITSFWNQLNDSLEKSQKMYYQQAAKVLGFEEMESLSMKMNMGDGISSVEMAVNMSGNDFPLYDLLIQADPGKLNLLESVPESTFSGLVSRIPDYAGRLPKIKQKVIESMTMFGQKKKQAKKQWKMGMMMAKKQLGVSVKKLLDQFGQEMAFYMTEPESTKNSNSPMTPYLRNMVVRLETDDGDAFETLFEEKISASSGYKKLKKKESTSTYNGTTLYTYDMQKGFQPTLFFLDDQIVYAGSKKTAKATIDGTDSVAGTSWFQSLEPELPGKRTSLSFTELQGYSKYMMAVQEESQNTTDFWSNVPINEDAMKALYSAKGDGAGMVFASSTNAARMTMNGTAEVDFSIIDPDAVNSALKDMIQDMEEKEGKEK